MLMKNKFAVLSLIATLVCDYALAQSKAPIIDQSRSTKENIMQNYTVIEKPSMIVVGIQCRTSNASHAGPNDIPRHWEKFYTEDTPNQIPNKMSNEVIALYCDYEGDYTQPYSLVIGCPVSSLDQIPQGMVAKIIPAGSYAVFRAIGEHPKSLIETWGKIWQQVDLERTYTGDYEIYGDKFISGSPKEVKVLIAIQQNVNLTEIDRMIQKNRQKLSAIKQLNLPIGHYIIIGSGALGIRNLREIGDIDIIVTPELWDILAEKYGVTDKNSAKKVVFPGGIVEAFKDYSFYAEKKDKNAPTLVDYIAQAEMIDGLPFEPLEHILYYKRKMRREKDLSDIFLIEKALNEKPLFEVRAFIDDIKRVKRELSLLSATFKGEYEFKDDIYHPCDREYDLNKEFVRLRTYQKTNWNQKAVELIYKVKSHPNHPGRSVFKKQFTSITEPEAFLNEHKMAFSYSRKGSEYKLGDMRIFVEDVEGLLPSIEIVSGSKEKMDQLFERLAPIQILSDSIPKLVESKLKI